MGLRSPAFPLLLNTSDHDLICDFFVPVLTQAFSYDRAGYFSSWWPRLGHGDWLAATV